MAPGLRPYLGGSSLLKMAVDDEFHYAPNTSGPSACSNDQHQLLFGSLAVISVRVSLACFSSDETNVSHWVNLE